MLIAPADSGAFSVFAAINAFPAMFTIGASRAIVAVLAMLTIGAPLATVAACAIGTAVAIPAARVAIVLTAQKLMIVRAIGAVNALVLTIEELVVALEVDCLCHDF